MATSSYRKSVIRKNEQRNEAARQLGGHVTRATSDSSGKVTYYGKGGSKTYSKGGGSSSSQESTQSSESITQQDEQQLKQDVRNIQMRLAQNKLGAISRVAVDPDSGEVSYYGFKGGRYTFPSKIEVSYTSRNKSGGIRTSETFIGKDVYVRSDKSNIIKKYKEEELGYKFRKGIFETINEPKQQVESNGKSHATKYYFGPVSGKEGEYLIPLTDTYSAPPFKEGKTLTYDELSSEQKAAVLKPNIPDYTHLLGKGEPEDYSKFYVDRYYNTKNKVAIGKKYLASYLLYQAADMKFKYENTKRSAKGVIEKVNPYIDLRLNPFTKKARVYYDEKGVGTLSLEKEGTSFKRVDESILKKQNENIGKWNEFFNSMPDLSFKETIKSPGNIRYEINKAALRTVTKGMYSFTKRPIQTSLYLYGGYKLMKLGMGFGTPLAQKAVSAASLGRLYLTEQGAGLVAGGSMLALYGGSKVAAEPMKFTKPAGYLETAWEFGGFTALYKGIGQVDAKFGTPMFKKSFEFEEKPFRTKSYTSAKNPDITTVKGQDVIKGKLVTRFSPVSEEMFTGGELLAAKSPSGKPFGWKVSSTPIKFIRSDWSTSRLVEFNKITTTSKFKIDVREDTFLKIPIGKRFKGSVVYDLATTTKQFQSGRAVRTGELTESIKFGLFKKVNRLPFKSIDIKIKPFGGALSAYTTTATMGNRKPFTTTSLLYKIQPYGLTEPSDSFVGGIESWSNFPAGWLPTPEVKWYLGKNLGYFSSTKPYQININLIEKWKGTLGETKGHETYHFHSYYTDTTDKLYNEINKWYANPSRSQIGSKTRWELNRAMEDYQVEDRWFDNYAKHFQELHSNRPAFQRKIQRLLLEETMAEIYSDYVTKPKQTKQNYPQLVHYIEKSLGLKRQRINPTITGLGKVNTEITKYSNKNIFDISEKSAFGIKYDSFEFKLLGTAKGTGQYIFEMDRPARVNIKGESWLEEKSFSGISPIRQFTMGDIFFKKGRFVGKISTKTHVKIGRFIDEFEQESGIRGKMLDQYSSLSWELNVNQRKNKKIFNFFGASFQDVMGIVPYPDYVKFYYQTTSKLAGGKSALNTLRSMSKTPSVTPPKSPPDFGGGTVGGSSGGGTVTKTIPLLSHIPRLTTQKSISKMAKRLAVRTTVRSSGGRATTGLFDQGVNQLTEQANKQKMRVVQGVRHDTSQRKIITNPLGQRPSTFGVLKIDTFMSSLSREGLKGKQRLNLDQGIRLSQSQGQRQMQRLSQRQLSIQQTGVRLLTIPKIPPPRVIRHDIFIPPPPPPPPPPHPRIIFNMKGRRNTKRKYKRFTRGFGYNPSLVAIDKSLFGSKGIQTGLNIRPMVRF